MNHSEDVGQFGSGLPLRAASNGGTHMYTDTDMTADSDSDDLDEMAQLRDDALINALAKGVLPAEYAADPLASALWSWREDLANGPVELNPHAVLSSVATLNAPLAVEAELAKIDNGTNHAAERKVLASKRRSGGLARPSKSSSIPSWFRLPFKLTQLHLGRRLVLSMAAATLGVVSLGSVAAASSAQPGDVLWPLTKVVNAERAQSLEAREEAFDRLHEARSAAKQNKLQTARESLRIALSDAEKVRDKDGREQLRQQLGVMQAQLGGPASQTDPATLPTSTPPPPAPTPTPPPPTSTPPPPPTSTPPPPAPTPTPPPKPPPPPSPSPSSSPPDSSSKTDAKSHRDSAPPSSSGPTEASTS
ncbi:MAG: hypothetical protein DLM55_07380 [Acidimicrobiales bacterium]|nr:MAG: hypothetical protein DLM55_07380 [Acidimicrobiales bacterium]